MAFDCDAYEYCKDCPGDKYRGPSTWPSKENLDMLLSLPDSEKIIAFDEIVSWFVVAKNYDQMEQWIASVLRFYIKKHLPEKETMG